MSITYTLNKVHKAKNKGVYTYATLLLRQTLGTWAIPDDAIYLPQLYHWTCYRISSITGADGGGTWTRSLAGADYTCHAYSSRFNWRYIRKSTTKLRLVAMLFDKTTNSRKLHLPGNQLPDKVVLLTYTTLKRRWRRWTITGSVARTGISPIIPK